MIASARRLAPGSAQARISTRARQRRSHRGGHGRADQGGALLAGRLGELVPQGHPPGLNRDCRRERDHLRLPPVAGGGQRGLAPCCKGGSSSSYVLEGSASPAGMPGWRAGARLHQAMVLAMPARPGHLQTPRTTTATSSCWRAALRRRDQLVAPDRPERGRPHPHRTGPQRRRRVDPWWLGPVRSVSLRLLALCLGGYWASLDPDLDRYWEDSTRRRRYLRLRVSAPICWVKIL